ncbi:MAG: peptidoglycan-binding protein [Rhizonema sp. NSF051]|nr:peptidoglycan-binding protein [Rhizonema sp. NSF051]
MNTVIPCIINRPTLEIGSGHQVVRQMQRVLNQRLAQFDRALSSPKNISETGHFDPNTLMAVKYLQCLAFLPVDGVVGPKTWAFLCDGPASLPRLRLGTASSVVKAVQEALKDVGYYRGAVDGVFGAKTTVAVQNFQKSCEIVADGVMGWETWNELIKLDVHSSHCRLNSPKFSPMVKVQNSFARNSN